MKRTILAASLLALAACGGNNDDSTQPTSQPTGKSDSQRVGQVESCSEEWLFEETPALEDFITGRTIYSVSDADEIPNIASQQILDALIQTETVEIALPDVADAFEFVDEGRVDVIELTLENGTELDWIQWYGGDNEVGALYEKGTLTAQAVVSDQWLGGCTAPLPELVCDGYWEQSIGEFEYIAGSESTLSSPSDLTPLMESQLYAAGVYLQLIANGESIENAFERVDEQEFYNFAIDHPDGVLDYYQAYAGDTEIGILFEAGTTTIVGEVGDGDVQSCTNKESTTEPTTPEYTCDYNNRWEYDSSEDLEPLVEGKDYHVVTFEEADELDLITQQQLFTAGVVDGSLIGSEDFMTVFEISDEGTFNIVDFETAEGLAVTWIQWYSGDTEVGVIFEFGHTNVLAAIGDGDIRACEAN